MDRTKRKESVKNLLIIFLLAMLLLTFFSNTIMNISLAEVGTAIVSSDTVEVSLREMGTVKAVDTYHVMLSQDREVESVKISRGDEVQAGDVLFVLKDTESEEIKEAQLELETQKLAYESAVLDTEGKSYLTENEEIKALQEALDLAVSEREKLGSTDMTLAEAKEQVDGAAHEADTWNNKVAELQTKISQVEADDSAYPGIRKEVLALEKARNLLAEKQSIYDTMAAKGTDTEAELKAAHSAVIKAQEKVNAAQAALNEKKLSEKKALSKELESAQKKAASANQKLLDVQLAYDKVSRVKEAESAVTEAKNSLNGRIAALASLQEEDGKNQKKTELDMKVQEIKIARMESEIEKMKKELEGTEVKAEHGGLVSAVYVEAGESVMAGESLAEIEVAGKGYTAELSILSEYAENLYAGIRVEISKAAVYGEKPTAEVAGIRKDVENAELKVVSLRLEGDVSPGETLTFIIPLSSGSYDAVVPKNAVRTDNNGDFVLTVSETSSPLGTRYLAVRIPVEVISVNDTQAAVSGISQGEYVITISSKPVSPGDYVKLSGRLGG